MKDFFISYTKADQPWAEWIAWKLEEAGYSTVIQAWDFRPGGNFVLEMQKAASGTENTIVVLSPAYLQSEFTQPEWAAAFAQDPHIRLAAHNYVLLCII
jgi:TIR domain